MNQTRYWIFNNNSAYANWNDNANWSNTSGGSGGYSYPTVEDVAIFDNNGLGNCRLNVNVTIKELSSTGLSRGLDFQANLMIKSDAGGAGSGLFDNHAINLNLNSYILDVDGEFYHNYDGIDYVNENGFIDLSSGILKLRNSTARINSSGMEMGSSTINFVDGDCTIQWNGDKIFNNLIVDAGCNVGVLQSAGGGANNFIVNGDIHFDTSPGITFDIISDLQVTGNLSSEMIINLSNNASISVLSGTIDCSPLIISGNHDENIVPGVFDGTVYIQSISSDSRFTFVNEGEYTFNQLYIYPFGAYDINIDFNAATINSGNFNVAAISGVDINIESNNAIFNLSGSVYVSGNESSNVIWNEIAQFNIVGDTIPVPQSVIVNLPEKVIDLTVENGSYAVLLGANLRNILINAGGQFEIFENSSAASFKTYGSVGGDSGVYLTVLGNFEVIGTESTPIQVVGLGLNIDGIATAFYALVSGSNANLGSTVFAYFSTDLGGNSNWVFGGQIIAFENESPVEFEYETEFAEGREDRVLTRVKELGVALKVQLINFTTPNTVRIWGKLEDEEEYQLIEERRTDIMNGYLTFYWNCCHHHKRYMWYGEAESTYESDTSEIIRFNTARKKGKCKHSCPTATPINVCHQYSEKLKLVHQNITSSSGSKAFLPAITVCEVTHRYSDKKECEF